MMPPPPSVVRSRFKYHHSILARNRTWSSTFAGSCAFHHTPRIHERCPGGFEPATSTFTASCASRLHHGHSASTRTRTRNPSFEARRDLRFTIEARVGTARHHANFSWSASESLWAAEEEDRKWRVDRVEVEKARRRTKKLSSLLSLLDSRFAKRMDLPGVEPGSPVCRTGIVPFDQRPSQGSGDRTHVLQLPRLADCRFPIPRVEWTAGESHPDLRRAGAASSCWTSSPKLRRWDLNPRDTAYETVLETGLQSTPQYSRQDSNLRSSPCEGAAVAAGPRE